MMSPQFIYRGTIINVVDGDTIDVKLDAGFYIQLTLRLRLLRVNAPELNSKDPKEKEKAIAAKNFVIQEVVHREVVLQTVKTDAFGRWLADVWYIKAGVERNLSDQLLELGLGVPFK